METRNKMKPQEAAVDQDVHTTTLEFDHSMRELLRVRKRSTELLGFMTTDDLRKKFRRELHASRRLPIPQTEGTTEETKKFAFNPDVSPSLALQLMDSPRYRWWETIPPSFEGKQETDCFDSLETENRRGRGKSTKKRQNPWASAELGCSAFARHRAVLSTDAYSVPVGSCPIYADVRTFDFKALSAVSQFDVIVADPPWKITSSSSSNHILNEKNTGINKGIPSNSGISRGVDIPYELLEDIELITCLDLSTLQPPGGWLFLWVINSRMTLAFDLLERWNYEYITCLDWVKRHATSGRLAASHGYFLQHAKEMCLVARKRGKSVKEHELKSTVSVQHNTERFLLPCDVLVDNRREVSQKTPLLYELIEKHFSNSHIHGRENARCLEIFGRSHNLRKGWVTIGDEL